MVISTTISDSSEHLHATFASRYVRDPLPKFKMPERSIPKEAAFQIISDELMLDGNPRLNLASFVTTWMEEECDKLIMASVNKNYVDMDEYPVTTELQNRCVNMIAHLFNAPVGENETAIGVGTVGSSEAIMLAGLAFKRKWQQKRKSEGKPYDKPNIVTGANVQVCWEKFARYFEVELKEVKLREGYYVMDPVKAVEMVDENTICVAAILGSTLTGEFEDVKLLNELLTKKNTETGWGTPIHVDAASGGFIAPFLHPDLEWDFRLPLVKSINVSGHKYGLVYAGVGWVVWRTKDDLPEELIFHINYLGSDQPTFTLNFSKGSSQIIAQYYQFIRLGFEGYKNIMTNCMDNANVLKQGLVETGRFEIVSKDIGVPLVAFSLKDTSNYTVFDISNNLRRYGWIIPAYTMPPDAEHIAVLRVVVREDFSRSLAERLLSDIEKVMREMDAVQSRATTRATHVIATVDETREGEGEGSEKLNKKTVMENREEIAMYWKRVVDRKKTSGVC
ncbi:glutamate decarboxylase [Vitis vinifera]|uniref:Glutamate decarboxylase n=2 Tax=Vitis vinifera TaxID=29760 RepID=F6I1W0_VITVI|nr:glutamate decarboxylase [Vitis vinifera]WES00151.1 glutamic acid decarboxylase 3 [Vitis vinifera]|eukprot:XP_002263081.1 PREDICTED: glutamate decarboxylase [Vitis vinifera]